MHRPKCLAASLLAIASAALASSACATAATKVDVVDKTISETVQFSATGCEQPSIRVVVFPKNAASITPNSPLKGTNLYPAEGGDPVAQVKSVSYENGLVTWTVDGIGNSCTAGTRWETARVELRVDVTVEEVVLTRATVIYRGEKICKVGVERLKGLLRQAAEGSLSRKRRAQIVEQVASVLRATNRKLGALKPERQRRQFFTQFRGGLDRMQLAADRAADALARADDAEAKTAVAEMKRHGVSASASARKYGFRGPCAH